MATIPTPTTQTAGLAVPAATINSQGNLATYLTGRTESGGARRPLSVMRQTIVQSIATATPTAILLDTEDIDYDGGHSTVTNTSRYTAGTTGWFWVAWFASFAANATGFRDSWIRQNGATDLNGRAISPTSSAAVQTGIGGTRLIFLNVADYIELMVNQNSGGALNTVIAAPDQCILSVQWASV